MLIQFTVENHRSIKNSVVISFAASKDKSFDEYLLHPDEKRLHNKTKSNNYTQSDMINEADRWRGRNVWYLGRSV